MRTKAEIDNNEWFGEVPDSWRMVPLPRLFMSSKGMTVTRADLVDEGAPVVNYAQVHSKLNNRFGIHAELIKHVPTGMVPKGLKYSEKGSFIFACTSEDLAGCGDCIYNDSEQPVNPGGDTLLLSPVDGVENKYLAYLFSTDMWRWQIRRDLVDVKVFHVNQGNLHETYVTVPPYDVQRRIISYLDERCAAIDEDVAKRREVIGKLKEYKRALIAHTVTKGLDPNVEMKASGVEWINEMPEGWNLSRLKSFYRLSKGLSITKADLVETGEPVISYGQIHSKWNSGTSICSDLIRYVPIEMTTSHPSSLAAAGSFIFADTSEDIEGCGNVAYVDEARAVYGGYHTIIATPTTNVCGKYFAYQFLTDAWRSQLIRQFVDVKLFSITQRALQQTSLIVPSYLEQVKIASYLDKRCAAIDEAVSRQEQLIERLGEYRKSVIHHAVTGKIDCTEA